MVVRVTQERACRGVRARRTAAVEVSEDGSALVSECFHFRLRADELHTTSVTVQALQPHSVYAKGIYCLKSSYCFTEEYLLTYLLNTYPTYHANKYMVILVCIVYYLLLENSSQACSLFHVEWLLLPLDIYTKGTTNTLLNRLCVLAT